MQLSNGSGYALLQAVEDWLGCLGGSSFAPGFADEIHPAKRQRQSLEADDLMQEAYESTECSPT
jgi:hypothetical protein